MTGVGFKMRGPMNKTEERLFEVNHFYEKLLDLRRTDPKAFNEMSPASKLSLYAYEAQKREHARLQAIRDEADAA